MNEVVYNYVFFGGSIIVRLSSSSYFTDSPIYLTIIAPILPILPIVRFSHNHTLLGKQGHHLSLFIIIIFLIHCSSPLFPGSTLLVLTIVILSVVILMLLLVGCILYFVNWKKKKTPNCEAGATIRMSAITTPSHTGQPRTAEHPPQVPDQRAENPYSTPGVGYAPAPTDPLISSVFQALK